MKIQYNNLIDASVFLEPIFEGEYKDECLKCVNCAGRTYNGFVLNLSLGETFTRMIEEEIDLTEILKYFHIVLKERRFKILRITSESLEISRELLNDTWFSRKIQDSIIVGNLISNKIDGLFTIDDELIRCEETIRKISRKHIGRVVNLIHPKNMF